MARAFGATVGSTDSDKVATTLSTDSTQRSFFMWMNVHGQGPGGFGKPLFRGSGATAEQIYDQGNTKINYYRIWTGGAGAWYIAAPDYIPTPDTWFPLGISYDGGATGNNPIFYLSGTKPTVTLAATPSGSLTSLAGSAYSVGNESTNAWNGRLAEAAIWDAILTDAEFFALCKGYSPALIRPQSLVEYVPLLRDNVSLKRAAPTITGTVVQPHPRVIMPRPMPQRLLHTAPTFTPAWSRGSNLPVLGTGTH